ncbi:zinc/manganese transport system permease protein [Azospirillaceae bacterium]
MTDIFDFLVGPFLEFGFMRRGFAACLALALGCGPVGVLLLLRRMSLMSDAMSHAILPGAAIGFFIAGLSPMAMSVGGFVVGLTVALAAGAVSRVTLLREDASFAGFYLMSLAAGVLIVSLRGGAVDLLHVLFGSVLAVDDQALVMASIITTLTLVVLAVIYRPLVVECFDPDFLRAVDGRGALYHHLFLVLVVLNLVGGFQALGTLMSVGLMILPAAAARFWAREVWSLAVVASLFALMSGYSGLLFSYYVSVPSGPAIILCAGMAYVVSIIGGRYGSLRTRYQLRRK